jgi:glutaredoxin-like protein DUF836
MPTEMAPLPDLVLYSRPGCHLCDEAREIVRALLDERAGAGLAAPPNVDERDIDADPTLHDRFLTTIPVLELGERRLELATSAGRIRRFLAETLDAEVTTAR